MEIIGKCDDLPTSLPPVCRYRQLERPPDRFAARYLAIIFGPLPPSSRVSRRPKGQDGALHVGACPGGPLLRSKTPHLGAVKNQQTSKISKYLQDVHPLATPVPSIRAGRPRHRRYTDDVSCISGELRSENLRQTSTVVTIYSPSWIVQRGLVARDLVS